MDEHTEPSVEVGTQQQDITAFNEAIAAVNEHNSNFSMGRVLARTVVEHLDQAQKVHELVDAGVTEEEAEDTVHFVGSEAPSLTQEEEMARAIVGITNAPILESAGLILSPLRTSATMHSAAGTQSIGEVRLQVADGGKFSSFLGAINPKNVDEDFKRHAASVVSDLVKEVTDAVIQPDDERTLHETLVYGKAIADGLDHIGLANSAEKAKLLALYEHSQQGDVKEYVQAERIQLFRAPDDQEFGPAQWQRDASAEYLTKHWNDVLEVIKAAKANPKAKELYDRILESAQMSLDYAIKDWDSLKGQDYAGEHYGEGFEQVFETVGLELSMLASPNE